MPPRRQHPDQEISVLIIGPLPPAIHTCRNPVGGAAVNFAEMVRQLDRRNFRLEEVDITRPRVNLPRWVSCYVNVMTAMSVIRRVLLRVRESQVVLLNLAAGRVWSLGSAIWMICRLFRRPIALRLFGGDFAETYSDYSRLMRWWADTTYMRCGRVYVQTCEIIRRFPGHSNIHWFANTRDLTSPRTGPRPRVRKLLFISQLRMEKGLREALEACRTLPPECHLTVYGPPMPDTNFALFEGHHRASYAGVLSPSEIPAALISHDVLVLPTYFSSEGYPGVILEAMQCGRPVISTWWRAIPEVVEHEKSGLLVTPRSSEALKAAIMRLIRDPALYLKLCQGARARGEFFRSTVWYDRMAKDLRRLASGA